MGKDLQFDEGCSCCRNNKNHFQINILEKDIEKFQSKKDMFINKIQNYKEYIKENSFYREIKKKIDTNSENKSKIGNIEKKIEIIIKSINLKKENINNIENANNESQIKMERIKNNEILKNKKYENIEKLNEKQIIYE